MTLPYSVCAALRDAGFPQKGNGYFLSNLEEKIKLRYLNDGDIVTIKYAYCPTTDELIEELGEDLLNLTHDNRKWHTNFIQGDEYDYGDAEGETPAAALASLYLSLHPKK